LDKEFTQEEVVKQAMEDAKSQVEDNQENHEPIKENGLEQVKEESEERSDSEPDKKEKKSKKKSKKDKKDEQIVELTDKLTRQMAEFDNFRKRTDKEKSQMYEIGAKDIIEKILPVVDNFDRGLNSVSEAEKESAFVEGMDRIYKQLLTTLEEVGVKPIEALGEEFNPDLHNAVMHIEDEEAGENIIVEEFQKGYTYRETVIRYSMVKVAN